MSSMRLRRDEGGFLMVALLVALSVMAVMLSVALPAWNTLARREKEAELVFRGEQYARAIALYQRQYANASPPDIDVLVNERFLRKKYKDPITNDDFQVLMAGQPVPGEAQPAARGADAQATQQLQQRMQETQQRLSDLARSTGGLATQQGLPSQGSPQGSAFQIVQPGAGRGGIVGVVSKSTEKSFLVYNGRDTYNQWVFMGTQQSARAGGPGANAPGLPDADGGRGGRGVQQPPGGRGVQPPGGRGPQPPAAPQPGGGFGGRNLPN